MLFNMMGNKAIIYEGLEITNFEVKYNLKFVKQIKIYLNLNLLMFLNAQQM